MILVNRVIAMFEGPSIQDMQIRPDLSENEEVLIAKGTELGDVVRNNVIIAVTTDRVIVRPKRGRNVTDEYANQADFVIQLKDLDIIRRTGALKKTIELVCGDVVYELPPMQNGSDDIIDAIIQQEDFGKTNWGEESTAKRGTKQLIAGIIGIIGVVVGGTFILLGIAAIVSIVGILLGIAFLGGGFVISYGSFELLKWGFNKEEEWDRNETPSQEASDAVESDSSITEGTNEFKQQIDERIVSSFSQWSNSLREAIPKGIWSFFVLIASLLWLSLFGLLENDSAFALVMFTAWVLLPVSIYLDSKVVTESGKWEPRKWAYVVASLIPIAGSIFGLIWLVRKRQKTGSALA